MAEEIPDKPASDDQRDERQQGRSDGRRGSSGRDPGSRDSGSSDWRGDGRSGDRRGGGSEWRPRSDRRSPDRYQGGGQGGGPRDARGPDERGGYRGQDDRRTPRRDDERGGYRGHAPRGGSDRPAAERDFRDSRPRPVRKPEPEIPEHIEAKQLDRAARRELLTLSKDNADGVARHLVASSEALAAGDLDGALDHAENASRRAGRVAIVREVLGFVRYRRGEWAEALREFRTARRLSGSNHLLPHMADVERGLGRPDRAIELSQEPAAQSLSAADRVELAIVVSGARRDLGQDDAAVQSLRELVQASPPERSWAPRLYYAYAEALLGADDQSAAREWFARALEADKHAETDAADRLGELDGVDITDLGGDDLDEEAADLHEEGSDSYRDPDAVDGLDDR